ncbi:hypothetical protein FTUN_4247 [Frigoriglobus tundricola]|uniref:Uncharacterized protein n=1 Tax=Frigoriglobus tundricola TaxID=2774151 RepID=A0A6M5YRR7_9BACT|nr:hypothetical protein FTUN_4247 [Frigoriglobus tundricola]
MGGGGWSGGIAGTRITASAGIKPPVPFDPTRYIA